MPIKITETNHKELIAGASPVILDFTAKWCGPCKQMKPHLEKVELALKDKNSPIVFGYVDVDEENELAIAYGITCMPTLIYVNDGDVVGEREGALNEEKILAFIEFCQKTPSLTLATTTA